MITKTKKSFGKGLEDVIKTAKEISSGDTSEERNDLVIKSIPLDSLQPCRFQPRKKFDESALMQLAESISINGVLQPIIVREIEGGFEIIAGERRWRASGRAGKKEIPCVMCNVDDATVGAYALIENIQRENLNAVEEALAFNRLIKSQSLTHDEVAKIVGKSRSRVTNTLRLLSLSEAVREMLQNRVIDMGHARALLSLSINQQEQAANNIVRKHMSVRQAESYISSLLSPKEKISSDSYDKTIQNCSELEKDFYALLDKDVKIKPKAGGRISFALTFSSVEDVREFYNAINSKN